jgi:hypothetical protein
MRHDATRSGSDPVAYLIAVRYRRGVVGETQRSCHLALVPDGIPGPGTFTALCGQQFTSQQIEQVEMFSGMPCVACLNHAAPSITGESPVQDA